MKILIAAPIDSNKLYCWKAFKEALQKLNYPNKEILLIDTSADRNMAGRIVEAGFTYHWLEFKEKPMDRVVMAREHLRKYALEHDFDYLLSLDADVIPGKMLIEELLLCDKDIVSAVCFTIGMDNLPAPIPMLFDGKYYRHIPEDWIGTGVREVDFIGLGCVLISRDALKQVTIRCERDPKGKLIKTDDCSFSEDLRRKGIKMFIQSDLQVSHKIVGSWRWEDA